MAVIPAGLGLRVLSVAPQSLVYFPAITVFFAVACWLLCTLLVWLWRVNRTAAIALLVVPVVVYLAWIALIALLSASAR